MKTPQLSDSDYSDAERAINATTSAYAVGTTREHRQIDSPEVTKRIDDYRMRIMQTNAEHGTLPFFLATLSFVALFANFGHKMALLLWVAAVLLLSGLRLFLISQYWASGERSDKRWVRYNIAVLAALGCLYGVTPFWLPINGEIWLLAVSNLWLAGLAISVLLSQGIIAAAGLAFAVPAIAPLLCLLLFSGDATQTLMGLGNVLLFTYLYSVIRRSRTAILDEARHRVMFEQLARHYDEQRQRSDKLVEELTDEIERRKKAEIDLREARDAAETISNQDHLTSLANRRVFDRVLEREWFRSLRAGKPLSLIICDIDRFRSYNTHYGNRAGDQCLVSIGQIITDSIKRAGDLTARYGGDQFSILLPDTAEHAALDIAETIRQAVHDQTILHPGSEVERVVTASFGVATLVPGEASRQHELIEAADHALRRAKRGGGNCVFAIYGEIANDEK